MSLVHKQEMTEENLAANRANGQDVAGSSDDPGKSQLRGG